MEKTLSIGKKQQLVGEANLFGSRGVGHN